MSKYDEEGIKAKEAELESYKAQYKMLLQQKGNLRGDSLNREEDPNYLELSGKSDSLLYHIAMITKELETAQVLSKDMMGNIGKVLLLSINDEFYYYQLTGGVINQDNEDDDLSVITINCPIGEVIKDAKVGDNFQYRVGKNRFNGKVLDIMSLEEYKKLKKAKKLVRTLND